MRTKKKNRWKAGLKWLIVFILLALLLMWLHELLDHMNFLAERVNEQGHTIDKLNGQLQGVTEQLHQTQAQLQLEHARVSDLVNDRLTQRVPNVNIGGQPIIQPAPEVHHELPKVPSPLSMVPIVIAGGLTILKSLLVPVFP